MQPRLPSYQQPNGPGSINVPFALSTPPANPAVLSYGELLDLWHRAGAAYGVPWQVLAAINRIESDFGRNMGPSSAGALGWMQFIPSTWMRWGMDADGDGVANPWDPEDAVFAAARYLAAAGAHDDLSRAIFAYNHAQWYVDDVLSLAAEFDSGDGGFAAGLGQSAAAFRLEALEGQLADARRSVSRAQRLIPQARKRGARLAQRKLALERRAGSAYLSTRKFEAVEAKIAQVERAEHRADAAHRPPAGRARRSRAGRRRDPGGDGLRRGRNAGFRSGRLACLGRRLRLPGRRRAGRRLGGPHASRLSGCRHRGSGRLAALRARRLARHGHLS